MNTLQKLLLVIATVIGIGMILYPPWIEFYYAPDGSPGTAYRGYHWIWEKPPGTPGMTPKHGGVRIYSGRLSPQLLGLFALGFTGYVVLGKRQSGKSVGDSIRNG